MKSNIKYSTNELLNYIELHLNGASYQQLCEDYDLNLNRSQLSMYVQRYLEHGVCGLLRRRTNRHYSKEFKHQVVQEYLNDNVSYHNSQDIQLLLSGIFSIHKVFLFLFCPQKQVAGL